MIKCLILIRFVAVLDWKFLITLIIGTFIFSYIAVIHSNSEYFGEKSWINYRNREPRAVEDIGLQFPKTNSSVADALAQQVRILCWVMTKPENYWKSLAVKYTWGKRCNILLFMSTKEDTLLPAVKLATAEGSDLLWGKTREAFEYVYEHHREDADWFLKADDDTYVIVENLRYLLMHYETDKPQFFGCHIAGDQYNPMGYMDGGAGYVLSRGALDFFIDRAKPLTYLCERAIRRKEDVEIGRCLANTRVKFMDTRDSLGRTRFLPFLPVNHILQDNKTDKGFEWYWRQKVYPELKGLNCCSDYTITIHRVRPQKMLELEYLIYQLKPYGINHHFELRPYHSPLPTRRRDRIKYLRYNKEYYYLWKRQKYPDFGGDFLSLLLDKKNKQSLKDEDGIFYANPDDIYT